MRIRLLLVFLAVPLQAHATVEGFVESFDGNGNFETIDSQFQGLDHPGWEIIGDGHFEAGGFFVENTGDLQSEQLVRDILVREVFGRGSFSARVEINLLDLGDVDEMDGLLSGASVVLRQNLDLSPGKRDSQLLIALAENSETSEDSWLLNVISSGQNALSASVPRGSHVAIGILYDDSLSEATFSYDHDIEDAIPAMVFGPLPYTKTFADVHTTSLIFNAYLAGRLRGLLESWSMTPLSNVAGDFDGNGTLGLKDIDILTAQVVSGLHNLWYDLNADSLVDDLDRQTWVHDLKSTYLGDADLNGTFDSTDLVQVLAFGEYEDGVELNSTWLTGDWDGDGDFTSGDLVEALADGGYDVAPGAAAVPEPAGVVLAIVAAALAVTSRRREGTRACHLSRKSGGRRAAVDEGPARIRDMRP
jgi:hypothetical protein